MLDFWEDRQRHYSDSWYVKDKAIEGLISIGEHILAGQLANCADGQRCGSLWCIYCLKQHHIRRQERLLRDAIFYEFDNSRMRHVTGHVGICAVDSDEVKTLLEAHNSHWRKIRRRERLREANSIQNTLYVDAMYEFEIVHLPGLFATTDHESGIKKQQIRQLIDLRQDPLDADVAVYVHWHAISNTPISQWVLDGDFGDKKLFRSTISSVHETGFHTNKSLSENLIRLAAYPMKAPSRFKTSFIGNDTGQEKFTKNEFGQLVRLYHALGGNTLQALQRSIKLGKYQQQLVFDV